jgi:pantetheine-phosphate adenylyltransferase
MAPDLESVYMMPSLDYSFISATLIKEISKLGGPVSQLVPEHVATALRNKFRANE